MLARLDLREVARPHLQALVAKTGETATLSAPGEVDAITVDFVQSAASVQSVARVGRPSVAHATATGKVLLAFGSAELPAGALKVYTPRTITDRARLAAELERVRRLGCAEAVGEREAHLNAIAAPVFDARGELAAIMGLQGPSSRFVREAMRAGLDALLDGSGGRLRRARVERGRRPRSVGNSVFSRGIPPRRMKTKTPASGPENQPRASHLKSTAGARHRVSPANRARRRRSAAIGRTA